MTKVYTGTSMSLDGYISGPAEDLVLVLLGGGTPFFDQLKHAPVELQG